MKPSNRIVPSFAILGALAAFVMVFALNCSGPKASNSAKAGAAALNCQADEVVNAFGRCEFNGPGAAGIPALSRSDFMTGLSNPWDLAF